MKTLAERLSEAQLHVETVEEEMSLLFSTLGIWDDIADWECNCITKDLLIYTNSRSDEPIFDKKVRAGLKAAGFSKVYFPDWGPLTTIHLEAKD